MAATSSYHDHKYQAPDYTGERTPFLADQQKKAREKEYEKVTSQSAKAVLGQYNESRALKIYQQFLENENKRPPITIPGLHQQVVRILHKRDELGGLHEVFTESHIEHQQILKYLKNARALGAFVSNFHVVEFDYEALEKLPKSEREMLWANLKRTKTEQRNDMIEKILMPAIAQIAEGLSQELGDEASKDLAWGLQRFIELIPARKEEFELQLEKMKLEQGPEAWQRHFIFNKLKEAVYLAKTTYKNDPRIAEQIETGEIVDLPALKRKLEEKTDGKYQVLADYFRQGYMMPQLSTDYAFDGLKFKQYNPFLEGDGYIRSIDFSLILLTQTSKYREPAPSCFPRFGKTPLEKQEEKMRDIKAMRNIGAFFEALMEGENARKNLERLCLNGNHLNERDVTALIQLLRSTQILHLDLSDTVFPDTHFDVLCEAIGCCTRLVTVDLSNIRLSEELPPACCSSEPRCGYSLITDEQIALLLQQLKPSKETLIEIWCHGPEPDETSENMEFPIIGNAAKESQAIILEIITSFPKLVSYNFSYQKISPDTVSTAVKFLMSNEQIAWVLLDGTRSEEFEEVAGCCGTKIEIVRDQPSKALLDEIRKLTAEHQLNAVQGNQIIVVDQMYRKYIQSLEEADKRIKDEKASKKKEMDESTRQADEAKHLRLLELASAGASRTTIQQNVPAFSGYSMQSSAQPNLGLRGNINQAAALTYSARPESNEEEVIIEITE